MTCESADSEDDGVLGTITKLWNESGDIGGTVRYCDVGEAERLREVDGIAVSSSTGSSDAEVASSGSAGRGLWSQLRGLTGPT